MMPSRYETMFRKLADRGEGALVPFLMLADPDRETCLARIDAVIAAGADALELGFPFSDPVADGPTLVAAANRALENGSTTEGCIEILESIRARYPDIPIGLLVYANLVLARGMSAFISQVALAGVDSLLVPDIPLREAEPLRREAAIHGVQTVFILPPDASPAKVQQTAAASQGYTYVLGRKGVTGAEQAAAAPLSERIAALESAGAPPAVIGFGVSTPAHVRDAITGGAAGVITGSALVDVFARGEDGAKLVSELKKATRQPVRGMRAACCSARK